jgi:hypothetical protein
VLATKDVASFAAAPAPRRTCPLHGGYLPCVYGVHCTAPDLSAAREGLARKREAESERKMRQLSPATLVSLIGKLVSARAVPAATGAVPYY